MCTWSVASGLGMGARLTGVLFDLLFFFFFFLLFASSPDCMPDFNF